MMMNKLAGRGEVHRGRCTRSRKRAGPHMPVKESHRSRLGILLRRSLGGPCVFRPVRFDERPGSTVSVSLLGAWVGNGLVGAAAELSPVPGPSGVD